MRTILVIDDDEEILCNYGMALERAGYRVFTANSGATGIAQARSQLPDLILCDINMPGMDGRHVLRSLREDAAVSAAQIVLMTGNTQSYSSRAGMELGADDFLEKPISLPALLGCIEARLQRAQIHWRVADRRLVELRANLRSTLPHEFFTPLAGMLGLVDVLRGDLEQITPAEVREMLDDIERSGWRLHRTLKNYLLALDLESAPEAPAGRGPAVAPAALHAAVAAGIGTAVGRHCRGADVTAAVAAGTVRATAADVTTLVEELVDNACSFSRPGTPIRVALGADGVLAITDTGRGMTPEQIRQIDTFRQFDRKKYEQQGLGLGLVLVRQLAARHGAAFSLASQPGAGTTATVAFVVLP